MQFHVCSSRCVSGGAPQWSFERVIDCIHGRKLNWDGPINGGSEKNSTTAQLSTHMLHLRLPQAPQSSTSLARVFVDPGVMAIIAYPCAAWHHTQYVLNNP